MELFHIKIEKRCLIHCGIGTPYINIDLNQHWHKAVTLINVGLSVVRFCGIYLRLNSQTSILYNKFENYTILNSQTIILYNEFENYTVLK